MLDRATHCRRRAGAPMKNLAHSASFHSNEKSAPSKPGTKHRPMGSSGGSTILDCLRSQKSAIAEKRSKRGRWLTHPDIGRACRALLAAGYIESQTLPG